MLSYLPKNDKGDYVTENLKSFSLPNTIALKFKPGTWLARPFVPSLTSAFPVVLTSCLHTSLHRVILPHCNFLFFAHVLCDLTCPWLRLQSTGIPPFSSLLAPRPLAIPTSAENITFLMKSSKLTGLELATPPLCTPIATTLFIQQLTKLLLCATHNEENMHHVYTPGAHHGRDKH